MTEKPILFSDPMVQAILDGRKTMTRRIAKATSEGCRPGMITPLNCYTPRGPKEHAAYCPYGQPGDRLWVRETWSWNPDFDSKDQCYSTEFCYYRADGEIWSQLEDPDGFEKWTPSIYMPRWASRITLEITAVRVERVQDITEDDARAEGVNGNECLSSNDNHFADQATAKMCFAALWDSINAKRGYGWDANPWVWVVSFGVIKPKL